MSDNTKIEWTDATWNPITGCSVVSPGCTNCYAMRLAGTRLRHHPSRRGLTRETKAGPVWTGEVRFNTQWLDQPLRWTRPRRIFVCAHADLFHEAVPDEWIDKVFAVMALAPQHVFQVLTKRPERMRAYFDGRRQNFGRCSDVLGDLEHSLSEGRHDAAVETLDLFDIMNKPMPNVWLGVSVEDQARADERIPILLDTPAAVRWVSAEPLLGPVDLDHYLRAASHRFAGPIGDGPLHWVVAGGESGPGARPMHPDWARSLRDQCLTAQVPFHFKQWGDWLAIGQMTDESAADLCEDTSEFGRSWCGVEQLVMHADGQIFRDREMAGPMVYQQGSGAMLTFRIGKRRAGRLLDGREWNGWPA